jgi:hypothetical protein
MRQWNMSTSVFNYIVPTCSFIEHKGSFALQAEPNRAEPGMTEPKWAERVAIHIVHRAEPSWAESSAAASSDLWEIQNVACILLS